MFVFIVYLALKIITGQRFHTPHLPPMYISIAGATKDMEAMFDDFVGMLQMEVDQLKEIVKDFDKKGKNKGVSSKRVR